MDEHEVKKVDFFREFVKRLEPGYNGPWLSDSLEPEELSFCGCCLCDEDTQINQTPRIIEVEIDGDNLNSAYSIFDNAGIKVLTGVFESLVNSVEFGELPNGDYTLCFGEDSRQIFRVFTLD
jgi:hypothetical protein